MALIAEWKARRANATVTLATLATHGGKKPPKPASSPATVATVATVTVTSTQKPAPTPPPPAPTPAKAASYTWPNTIAMNAAEVAQAAQRHARLVAGGLSEIEADREVDRLLQVDRAGAAVPTPATPPAQTTARKLHPCAASLPEWRERDRLWQAHHFACGQCIAAGRGYGQRCPEGLTLLEGAQC